MKPHPVTTAHLAESELDEIRTLIEQRSAILFDSSRERFFSTRIREYVDEKSLATGADLLRLVRGSSIEYEALLERLLTQETSFFRYPEIFSALEKTILPELQERKFWQNPRTLRIWSAGCSTGQEPYTLAIMVCDALAYYYLRNPLPFAMPTPKPLIPPPWKVEILASDINYSALLTGQQGNYSETQMETVDYTTRLRYFDKIGDKYAVKAKLKELVQFDFHNLKADFLPQRNDAIFCRNVMIYFDEPEQKRLIDKFYRCLNPEGYLFVGHAESLFGLTKKFHMIHQNNATVYQRIEGAK
jgi:chemotaxis protein methyltransferase CheR